MIKKFLLFFLFLIFLLIFFIAYLNYIGLETDKFNSTIKNQIKSYDSRINVELKKVKLLLDIKNLSIKVKTKDPIINFDKKTFNIKSISSNISIKSYFINDFGIKNLLIKTKKNKIKDIIYLTKYIDNSPRYLILSQFIKQGNLETTIKLEFNEKGEIKNNYILEGSIEDGKIKYLNNYIYESVKFEFEYKENNLQVRNLNFNLDNAKFDSSLIEIKKIKSDYFFKGHIENNKTSFNTRLFNLTNLNKNNLFNINNTKFVSNSNFSFQLNKKLKIKDLEVKSLLDIYNLDYIGNKEILKKYFPGYSEKINFKKIGLNLIYNKKNFKILGDGVYGINNNEDKIKFNIKTKKDIYNFNATIDLNKNRLVLNEIDYFKDTQINANLNITGKYQENKILFFKKIVYSENKNNIIINNLKLGQKNKIVSFKNISLNYLTKNDIVNQFNIIYNQPNYSINGKSYDSIKLIKNITDNDNETNFFDIFKEINSKISFDLKNVYLDKENIAKNLNGTLELNKNNIVNLNLNSNFSENEKFSITIRTPKNNQKVTTLYSDRALPFVRNFKFIEGFENGILDYTSSLNNKTTVSNLKIYDFKVKKVPILAKLLTLASLQGIADLLTGEGIRFDEFEMNYSTEDKLITIDEIYSIGPSISILVEGYIQSDELISLRGTLVPATTINKFIGKIKVIGNILVGKKKGEGVFGVSFKIKGPPKDLKTTVNPIKTLTPRFITRTLEKIKKSNQ
tara:strand:- start:1184 stop:3394 length:2211 start_codon:yes stop_codon:yes gene_type:complete